MTLSLPGGPVSLLPEEIEVELEAPEGLAIAEGGGFVVALSTEITPQLRREGIAREISRALNQLRKDADYKVSDRIAVFFKAEGAEARAALREFKDFICRETLADQFREADPPRGDREATLELEEGKIALAVKRESGSPPSIHTCPERDRALPAPGGTW